VLTAITFALLTLVHASARADDAPAPTFAFNGYGTFGLLHSSEDQADYVGNILRENGAGHTRNWSAGVDSRVGAQLSATFNSGWSAVVQVLAEQRFDGTYTPHVEWANIEYELTPGASVRIGRIVLPTFLFSDSVKVGYAYPWLRPPAEVYGLMPISTSDGVDARYQFNVGGVTSALHAHYGQSNVELPGGSTARVRNHWGLKVLAERSAANIYLSYQEVSLAMGGFNKLFDAFRQFGPEGIAIARKYDADGVLGRVVAIGAQYDPGDWFAMEEWGTRDLHSAFGDLTAWYAGGGYRFGALTPYVTYSEIETDSNVFDPGLTVSAYPPELAGEAAGLNAALNGTLGASPFQDTIAVGVRWDFRKNFALKLQFDRSSLGAGSPGILGNVQPGFRPGGSYELISAAVDFVF
jgi:hypothetical protein